MNEKHDAKYLYLYLLSLISLIFLGLSVGSVFFAIINLNINDPLLSNYYSYSGVSSSLKFAIAAILVSAPVYFTTSCLIEKGLKKKEIHQESSVRKFLTYFILLISSVIILGIFISIVSQFLNGGLSLKLGLKLLTTLIISAIVFSYYFYDIKSSDKESAGKVKKIFFYSSLALVVASFILALFFIESPKVARMRKFDENLASTVQNLRYKVADYYYQEGVLPESIDDLSKNKSFSHFDQRDFVNPKTGKEVEYKKINDNEFEICSDYLTSNLDSEKGVDNFRFRHDKGYYCVSHSVKITETKSYDEKLIF